MLPAELGAVSEMVLQSEVVDCEVGDFVFHCSKLPKRGVAKNLIFCGLDLC